MTTLTRLETRLEDRLILSGTVRILPPLSAVVACPAGVHEDGRCQVCGGSGRTTLAALKAWREDPFPESY